MNDRYLFETEEQPDRTPVDGDSYLWRIKPSGRWNVVIDFVDDDLGTFSLADTEFVYLKEWKGLEGR